MACLTLTATLPDRINGSAKQPQKLTASAAQPDRLQAGAKLPAAITITVTGVEL
ncbi:hypothetical protein FY034_07235 [Trichlorobacter lovleyi]|nr:hypothetical protein FY034_07235 [Trichlorobacter lovleyi]